MAGKTKSGSGKIFISLGTHPQQFNRLLEEIDLLVANGEISGEILAQTGHSTYVPKNYSHKNFLGIDEFRKNVAGCSIFITHAGEGNIGLAKNSGKKFICVPRRKETQIWPYFLLGKKAHHQPTS